MSTSALLVIVSSLHGGGVMTHTQAFETATRCEIALETAARGIEIVFAGNTNSNAQPVSTTKDGWHVVQTPVKRVIAALKCEMPKLK